MTNVADKRVFRGEWNSPLREQEMLRASPLKPTKGSAFGNRKPLKRLDLNFECLKEVCQLLSRK